MLKEKTAKLVSLIMNHQVQESEDLEWKGLEKISTPEGRQTVVKILSAMANTYGGTMLIGVGPDSRGSILQSVQPGTEPHTPLYQVMQDSTRPPLHPLVDIRLETLSVGTIIRIDVKRSPRQLIEYRVNDSRHFCPYIRVGSTTREMTPLQIQAAAVERLAETSEPSIEVVLELSDARPKPPKKGSWREADGRLEWQSPIEDVVLGGMIPFWAMGKSVLYTLRVHVHVHSDDSLNNLLEMARVHLGISLDADLVYAIGQSGCIRNGWGARNLFEDWHDLPNVVDRLLDLKGSKKDKDMYYAPNLIAYAPAGGALFWLELESRQNDKYRGAEVGLILENPLFDDKAVKEFFRSVGSTPRFYESSQGPQIARISSQESLRGAVPIHVDSSDDLEWRILVDNPMRGRIITQSGTPRAAYSQLVDALNAIPKLPLEVRGGLLPHSDKKFDGILVEAVENRLGPGIFVGGICSATR